MMKYRKRRSYVLTYSNHWGMPVCRECAQIVVKKVTDEHVYIYHKETCVPRKYRKKEVEA